IIVCAFQAPVRQRLRHNLRDAMIPSDDQHAFAVWRVFRSVRRIFSLSHGAQVSLDWKISASALPLLENFCRASPASATSQSGAPVDPVEQLYLSTCVIFRPPHVSPSYVRV